jgi:hypothetical protein
VHMIMNLWLSQKVGNFLTNNWVTMTISRRALLHGVHIISTNINSNYFKFSTLPQSFTVSLLTHKNCLHKICRYVYKLAHTECHIPSCNSWSVTAIKLKTNYRFASCQPVLHFIKLGP